MATEGNDDLPVPDLRTMEKLCQPSLNGRGGPIPRLLFNIKVNGVTDDALRLYLFPHSLTHHSIACFDRLPRNSINTFEQMAKMFLGKYFPPSIVTKLINEITNFRQHPDELLFEAWEWLTSKSKQFLRTMKLVVVFIPPMIVQPPLATPRTYMLREPIKGASHGQNPPPAYQIPAYQAPIYQALVHQPQIPQPQVATTNKFTNFMKFMKMNTASSSGSGTLPSNTITNPKEELKGITTRSGTAYQGPTIPTTTSSSSPIVERETETESPILNSEPVVAPIIEPVASPVSASRPKQRPSIPRSFLKIERDLIDVFKGELTLCVGKKAITFNLDQTSRYSANYNDMMANQIDVIDMACEEYSQEVLGFYDVIASGNPTPYYDLIVSTASPTLTPFENSDFLLEEVDAFLALEDDPTSPEVDQSYIDTEGDILLLEAFLNDDPSLSPPNQGNYLPQI
uniref:Reverse transcriptase domain-containing protein n=1 Tax=Tanacetum cinerariifolium TaxID=118510 RepID=A0A6L2KIG6_TANCI|nr:reverse transcriptase domain-containing protein [Tanacetum cinerariifolium]